MSTKPFYFALSISLFVSLFAQDKHILFLHGYDSDGATAWTSSKVGNIPQDWVDEGVISSTAYHAPTISNFTDTDAVKLILSSEFQKAPTAKWIIVGHSLGGLIARASETSVKSSGINLKGIITLGTPHQGAPVASQVLNTAYAQSMADQIKQSILDGPEWQGDYGWLDMQLGLAYSIFDLVGNVNLYTKLSTSLGEAHQKVSGYINRAAQNHAEYLIPGSPYLQSKVYSVNSTVPHISVSGIESAPHAFIRFISGVNDVGAVLGNEKQAVQKVSDAISFYSAFENYHEGYLTDWLKYIAYPYWLLHHEGMIYWRHGREALQNLDLKWAELHDDLYSYTNEYTIWVNCSDLYPIYSDYSVRDLEVLFETVEAACKSGNISGFYKTYYITTYYYAPTDGFIPRDRTKWNSTESITSNPSVSISSASAISQGNVCFNGTGEADGGYNHMELRFHKRDNGSSTPVKTTPTRFSQEWAKWWSDH